MIQAIVHLLTESTQVQAIVGRTKDDDKWCVFPTIVMLGEVGKNSNYICAAISGTVPTPGRCVSLLDKVTVDLLIYSDDYAELDALANVSRIAIDGHKGNVVGVTLDGVKFANEYDDYDDTVQKYLRVQTYQADVRRNITV
jgi:hypothetical protein